jgi:hypothetical protein
MFTLQSLINHSVLEKWLWAIGSPSKPGMTIGPLEVATYAPAQNAL